jgi:hypothetical protein
MLDLETRWDTIDLLVLVDNDRAVGEIAELKQSGPARAGVPLAGDRQVRAAALSNKPEDPRAGSGSDPLAPAGYFTGGSIAGRIVAFDGTSGTPTCHYDYSAVSSNEASLAGASKHYTGGPAAAVAIDLAKNATASVLASTKLPLKVAD